MEAYDYLHCDYTNVLCECLACDNARRDRIRAFAENFSFRAYQENRMELRIAARNERREESRGDTLRPRPIVKEVARADRVWSDVTEIVAVVQRPSWFAGIAFRFGFAKSKELK